MAKLLGGCGGGGLFVYDISRTERARDTNLQDLPSFFLVENKPHILHTNFGGNKKRKVVDESHHFINAHINAHTNLTPFSA